jgi:hypothetical protein
VVPRPALQALLGRTHGDPVSRHVGIVLDTDVVVRIAVRARVRRRTPLLAAAAESRSPGMAETGLVGAVISDSLTVVRILREYRTLLRRRILRGNIGRRFFVVDGIMREAQQGTLSIKVSKVASLPWIFSKPRFSFTECSIVSP